MRPTLTAPPPDLLPPPPDLRVPADLTPPPPDLTTPPDFTGVTLDLTAPPPDLTAAAPDQAVVSTPDLTAAPADMAKADQSVAVECDHDTECAGTTCGGQVCRWASNGSQMCVAAGTDAEGSDGWCNKDDECKCKGEGATCNLTTLHCTFTTPRTKGSDKGGCAVGEGSGTTAAFVLFAMTALLLGRRRAVVARRNGRRTS